MNTKTKTKSHSVGNIDMARAFQELRRSNATVPKPVKALRKQRTRAGAKRAAVRDF